MVYFSKLAFNHNQEKGSNLVVLCTTEGCNRAISGEKVLYFTSRYIFYCLVCFSSKTLVVDVTALSLRDIQITVSGQMQNEVIFSNGSGITEVIFSFPVAELLHLEAANFALNLWNSHGQRVFASLEDVKPGGLLVGFVLLVFFFPLGIILQL